MENIQMSDEKEKKLKHIKVYDKLYVMIKDGTYGYGSKLPSEPELAIKMNVSRMTLRRALALLHEDNLITPIHGKGNFINSEKNEDSVSNLSKINHLFRACSDEEWDEVELEFRIEPPSEPILQVLEQKSVAVVICDRWYKKDGKVLGYTLSFVPIEVISEREIDLSSTKSLEKFLESTVYDIAYLSKSIFSHTTTGNFTASRYILSENNSFILTQNKLYTKDNKIILVSKHYIPVEYFKTQISLTKDFIQN